MFADDDCPGFFASQLPKDLRALAIKSLAECDIRRNRLRPPIAFDLPIFSNVAHDIGRALEHMHVACEATRHLRLVRFFSAGKIPAGPTAKMAMLLRWKVSRSIEFRVNAAPGQKFRAVALFDDSSVIKHDDLVKVVNRRQSMCGNQSCSAAH